MATFITEGAVSYCVTPTSLLGSVLDCPLDSFQEVADRRMDNIMDNTFHHLRSFFRSCDNFFTSYELGQQLLKWKMTMVLHQGRIKDSRRSGA